MTRFIQHLREVAIKMESGRQYCEELLIQPLPGIGDMIWHLPVIHAIAKKAAGGKVCVLTKPRSQGDRLLLTDETVADVLWLERNPGQHDGFLGIFRLAAMLRRYRFKRVWILHGSWRYALAAWLAGIPDRRGYGCGAQHRFLNNGKSLSPAQCKGHPVHKAGQFLECNGIRDIEPEPRLTVNDKDVAKIVQRYDSCPMPWIALGIGSSEPYKQWGDVCFSQLAKTLSEKYGGTIFIMGGESEREMAARIVEQSQTKGVIEAIALPMEETAALLGQCKLYVGNDTGVLNMSAAVGVESVGLFGSSEPLLHTSKIHCMVPDDAEAGMKGINVGTVAEKVSQLI